MYFSHLEKWTCMKDFFNLGGRRLPKTTFFIFIKLQPYLKFFFYFNYYFFTGYKFISYLRNINHDVKILIDSKNSK